MIETDEKILHRVRLRPDHRPTGHTKHTVNGITVGPPFELQIVQFDNDPGYYLLHLSQTGEKLTDTYHDSCEQAMEQTEFEFGVKAKDWT